MPARVFTQRNAAAIFLLSSLGLLYTLKRHYRNGVRVPATATAGTAQGAVQIPSFALGGCERSGGGI